MDKITKFERVEAIHKWGTGLFENDADSFIVRDLFKDADIKEGHSTCFLYLGDVEAHVYRKKLDAGVLNKMLKKRLPIDPNTVHYDKNSLWVWPDRRGPGYQLCLLGAITMQLGCKLPSDLRQSIEDLYTKVGFSRNAQVQLRHALNVYVDGVPYNFRWKHRPTGLEGDDFAADPIWGDISEILINAGGESDPAMRMMSRQIFGPMMKCTVAGDNEYPQKNCGNCGRKKAKNGSPCRPCSLCGQRRYCSRKCELAHRPKHQLICDDLDYRIMGNVWAKSGEKADAISKDRFAQRVSGTLAKMHPRITELDDETPDTDDQDDTTSTKYASASSSSDIKWGDLDDKPRCGNCGTEESLDKPLSSCKKCGEEHYCNKKCQKAHWYEHKKRCLTSGSA